MRHPVHALFRVTAFAALLAFPARALAEAAPDPDEAVDQITQMNRDAVTAYQAKKYEDARKILKQALDLASTAGLDKHPIKARTHIHFGIVAIVGFKQRDLGIKQFKKAIEIQSDIGLTKALVTPELTDAFNEAKGSGGPTPPTPATPPEPPPPPKPATPPPASTSEAEVPASGLVHEPVSEGKQGSAISVTVGVQNDLQFEKMILAYRPEGASEFLGREMKEVADGRYGAEIPTSATSGGTVAYYIEAEDANGAPVAARGSVDNPLVIRLLGVGVSRREDQDEEEEEDDGAGPDHRYFVGLMAGKGFGWATGNGDTNHDIPIDPSGLAGSGLVQFSPEVGYWLNSSLMLSLQIRYEYITGTTDIYEQTPMQCPNGVCKTANFAFAAFAKATWKYGEGKFHPFFSLAAGGGRIRHVVSYSRRVLPNCGPSRNATCVDTIGAGPVLLGPGGGAMYDITETASIVVQANSVLAFPDFTFHLDANLGVAFAF